MTRHESKYPTADVQINFILHLISLNTGGGGMGHSRSQVVIVTVVFPQSRSDIKWLLKELYCLRFPVGNL